MNVTISTQIPPTFDAIGPLCQNSAAPALPATSKEGIAGTWNPAAISTATVGTQTYTFTPTGGSCAIATTLNVTISTQITPTFDAIGPLCQNSAAPALPATSKEGIAGTWNPSCTISTATVGTQTYTFTPTGGSCAIATTLNVTISTQITPTFAAIGPLCQNSAAPTLPCYFERRHCGNLELPAAISTATVGTQTYTFTPTGGSCAIATTLNVTISTQITPTFDAIGPLCQNSARHQHFLLLRKKALREPWNPAAISTATSVGTQNLHVPHQQADHVPIATTLNVTISHTDHTNL